MVLIIHVAQIGVLSTERVPVQPYLNIKLMKATVRNHHYHQTIGGQAAEGVFVASSSSDMLEYNNYICRLTRPTRTRMWMVRRSVRPVRHLVRSLFNEGLSCLTFGVMPSLLPTRQSPQEKMGLLQVNQVQFRSSLYLGPYVR